MSPAIECFFYIALPTIVVRHNILLGDPCHSELVYRSPPLAVTNLISTNLQGVRHER